MMGKTEVDTSKCSNCAHKCVCEKITCAECDTKKSWVVVYRPEGDYPRVRHIVTITGPYKEDEFKEWYYESFHKLDGDAFKHCCTENEKQTFIDSLN